jgi:hypothetical protein
MDRVKQGIEINQPEGRLPQRSIPQEEGIYGTDFYTRLNQQGPQTSIGISSPEWTSFNQE